MLGWLRRLNEWDKARAYRAAERARVRAVEDECRRNNVCPQHMLPYRWPGLPECETCGREKIDENLRRRDTMQEAAERYLEQIKEARP